MKVDSAGQPITEGTFGFYLGNTSAKVARTFSNPAEDGEDAQEIIADGGYMLEVGPLYGGTVVADPSEFTATYDGDTVKAQDGQTVRVGDKVKLAEGTATSGNKPGEVYTIRNLYPIGTLQGQWCASLEDCGKGQAPDGYYGLHWGSIAEVVERAKEGTKAKATSTTLDPKNVKVGDWIEFLCDDLRYKLGGEVIAISKSSGHLHVKLDAVEKGFALTVGSTYWANSVLQDPKHLLRHLCRVKEKSADTMDKGEGYETPAGTVYAGDIVRVVKGDNEFHGEVLSGYYRDKSDFLNIRCTVNIKGHEPKVGNETAYFNHRVVEIISSEHAGAETDTDNNADNNDNDEEQTMAVESKPMSEAQRSKKFGKVEVERTGTQITLPTGMGLRTAIAELQRQAEQEEMDVNIMELIEGFPLDAAHAFVKALELRYGWVNALPTPGFFGPQPPVMIGVQVDPDGRTVQIPWGQLGIPGISGKLSTGIQFKDNRPVFCIGGTIKQKDKYVVNEIAQMARQYLKENSIYRGKAIRVRFPEDPKKFSPLDHQPKFIQTADVRPEELIFSAGVEKQVRVNIWTPIQSLAAVKAARVPLKRGVLLYGRYGVGKTLLASVTARMAVQAGVTFMDLEDSRQLPQAVQFARMFGGMVVIFAEDIDRCDENGTRTDAFNDILNTVDGLTSKTDEVLIVYTTNHIEKISKAMLRQGRIDKVINIKAPDADAAQRLVRLYARHMLSPDEDLAAVGELLVGFIPAAIREVVEQSKLAAIERGDVHRITAEDLRVTVENTLEHMDLLKETPKDDRSELERAADAFGKRVAEGVVDAWHGEGKGYSRTNTHMGDVDALVESVTKRKAA